MRSFRRRIKTSVSRLTRSVTVRSQTWPTTLSTCLSLVLAGCSGDHPDGNAVKVKGHGAWLDTIPLAQLGRGDSMPFFQVTGAVLSGDTIIVAERRGSLRFYLRTGEFLRTVGGAGEGPGEFRMLTWVQKVGEHLFAYDRQLRRLSEFTSDGSFQRSVQINLVEGYTVVSLTGIFADGSLLVAAYARGENVPFLGVRRRRTILLRYDAGGMYVDSLGTYEGVETWVGPMPRGGQAIAQLPFGRRSTAEASGSEYYVLENNDYGIAVFDQSGRKVRELWPLEETQTAVSDNHVRAVRGLYKSDAFDQMPIPDKFPPYGWNGLRRLELVHVSAVGDLWVLNGDDQPAWTVFTNGGTVRGKVRAFEGVDVLDADDDIAVVLHWDELDVESVEVRRIRW